jgi:SSS family solute:Na+ symporter
VQERIYRRLGALCLIYGAFVLLLVLIPNHLTGRLCFVFCGGAIFGMGGILTLMARREERRLAAGPEIPSPPSTTASTPVSRKH